MTESGKYEPPFLQLALNLGFIDISIFNQALARWEEDKTQDIASLLKEMTAITDAQIAEVTALISSNSGTVQQERIYATHYLVKDMIGRGGVGRVWLAFDKSIERDVAIKELLTSPGDPRHELVSARFLREAKITGQLEHPGIVPVYELGEKEDGRKFYAMKYVRGRKFKDLLDSANFSSPEENLGRRLALLDTLINVAEAVGYAHSRGVIHRDIKPGNIILGQFGETIIIDWGLAKAKDSSEGIQEAAINLHEISDDDASTTKDGQLMGTPAYMAPEQVDIRFGRVDECTDVYALGVILFIILTGERPYQGSTKEVMGQIMSDKPTPSPLSRYKNIPPELSAIAEKATQKDKGGRYRNAAEFAQELKAFRDGRLVSSYAYTRRELFKRFVARNKTLLVASLLVIISIMGGAGFSLDFAFKAKEAQSLAEQALADVTGLAEESSHLAETAAIKLDEYFKTVAEQKTAAPSNEVELLAAEIPRALSFDPKENPYLVWCLAADGQIIYDEDPAQVGINLFTDKMYAAFPELRDFGIRIIKEPWGIGYYSFYDRAHAHIIHKIAAWDTFSLSPDKEAKIVVSYPYHAEK